MSRLISIVLTVAEAYHGDDTDENYTFQAYARNVEILTFKSAG